MRFLTPDEGSSPLTRGKHNGVGRDEPQLRLIPAHAGKTEERRRAGRSAGAHPRSRGENQTIRMASLASLGSSPLTRGKRWSRQGRGQATRLIPAHAGKTTTSTHDRKRSRAHPRSRGENLGCQRPHRAEVGSSPLTRGKQTGRDGGSRRTGLIPAHAGKTRARPAPGGGSRAHPRSRGENRRGGGLRVCLRGSSPLTRGKH